MLSRLFAVLPLVFALACDAPALGAERVARADHDAPSSLAGGSTSPTSSPTSTWP